jgi:hypothetical protein
MAGMCRLCYAKEDMIVTFFVLSFATDFLFVFSWERTILQLTGLQEYWVKTFASLHGVLVQNVGSTVDVHGISSY